MAEATPPVPIKPPQPVLVFIAWPEGSLNVEKVYRDTSHLDDAGRPAILQRGKHRVLFAQRHRLWIEERDMKDKMFRVKEYDGTESLQLQQVGVRNMEGYMRDFFEAIRTPGTPKDALVLSEMLDDQDPRATAFMERCIDKSKTSLQRNPITIMELTNAVQDEFMRVNEPEAYARKQAAKQAKRDKLIADAMRGQKKVGVA